MYALSPAPGLDSGPAATKPAARNVGVQVHTPSISHG